MTEPVKEHSIQSFMDWSYRHALLVQKRDQFATGLRASFLSIVTRIIAAAINNVIYAILISANTNAPFGIFFFVLMNVLWAVVIFFALGKAKINGRNVKNTEREIQILNATLIPQDLPPITNWNTNLDP